MERYDWLMLASAAVWAALGGYIFAISRRQANLEKRLAQMEQLGCATEKD